MGLKLYYIPSYVGDSFINHEIRIPIKQPGYIMKSQGPRDFFFCCDSVRLEVVWHH